MLRLQRNSCAAGFLLKLLFAEHISSVAFADCPACHNYRLGRNVLSDIAGGFACNMQEPLESTAVANGAISTIDAVPPKTE